MSSSLGPNDPADPPIFPFVDVAPEAVGNPGPLGARLGRLARIRQAMAEQDVDALLLSLGADLPWLTGYEAMPLERPTVLVLPLDAEPTLVVPRLEAPRVEADERLFSLRPWDELEDPVGVVASLVGARRRLAVSDRAWASLLLELQRALPEADWRPASAVVGPIRAVKDAEEIAALAAAGAAADRVADALLAGEIPLVGRTEADVSGEITRRLLAEGHSKVGFAIVGSGPNAASPHHEPGARVIGRGETVVCDFGGTFRLGGTPAIPAAAGDKPGTSGPGYCSDTTRTVITGEPSAEVLDCYRVLQAAQAAAVAAVRPGVTAEAVDRAAREPITEAGFGELFVHRTGHGIGVEEHEAPWIVEGNAAPLEEGNAFSVEPGIYVPGRFGARIEDIVVVTSDGVRSLNTSDHSLHVVEA
ncbi:MAG: putative dipeptidase [Acidimicrobiaceae bacterium]|nr:putative dipeptidase [Acidimicrobiaceae bacterium]